MGFEGREVRRERAGARRAASAARVFRVTSARAVVRRRMRAEG